MRTKRLLIAAPLVLIAFLLQSYAWVPSYERQTRGNPERLRTFIAGRIGDAKILNPALNADAASSEVVSYVFEGLLDLDEKLELRGALATSWEVSEVAYLLVRPERRFPDGAPVTAERLLERIRAALGEKELGDLAGSVVALRRLPPERREEKLALPPPAGSEPAAAREIAVAIEVPERIVFELRAVVPELDERLAAVVGRDYARDFPYARHIHISESDAEEAPRAQVSEPASESGSEPGADAALRNQFAQLLPVIEHNPVLLFHLRHGARFHDGHEFGAGDVAFTVRAILDPRNLSPRTSDFEPIKAVEVVDRHTVRVVYKRLFSPAIYSWTYMGILPEHLLDEAAMAREMERRGLSPEARANFGVRDSEFNRAPIGTGRFRFVEWQSDEFLRLERFAEHWDRPAEFHDVFLRVIPDMLTQEVEFRSGAIDEYSALPHQAARYRDDDRYTILSTVGGGYSYIGYNHRRPPFDDPRVRRALGMAINVEEIIDYILFGEGEQVSGPYPINTVWYDRGVEPLPYDPAGALRILNELGWRRNAAGWLEKDGRIFEFNLITNNGNPIRKNILTIAQNAWKKIGIKCNTQLFEWAVFLEDFVNPGKFDAVVLGWSMGIDPDLYQIWHSSQNHPYQLNFIGYRNPEVDRLIERIREEYVPEQQKQLAYRLHHLIAEEQPYTFLFTGRGTTVLDKKIVVVERAPDGSERYREPYVTERGTVGDYRHKLRKLESAPRFSPEER